MNPLNLHRGSAAQATRYPTTGNTSDTPQEQAPPRSLSHRPQNPYATLDEFVRFHGLVLPRPRATWRLVLRPCVGYINGLDLPFSGLTIATNGILVAILSSAGSITIGHLQWFMKSNPNEESDLDHLLAPEELRRKKATALREAFDTFEDCL